MKSTLKRSLIFCSALFGAFQVQAQQSIQFTQYIFNSLSVNPAYAGYKEEWFAQLGLRSQWVGLDGAPQTGTISVDGVLDPIGKRHGVGLNITSDKLGAQGATSFYVNYALRLQMDDDDTKRLSLGIAGGVTQYSLDGNKLNPIDFGDVVIPDGKINDFAPDIRLGVYYTTPTWYVGASVQDLFSGSSSGKDYRFNSTTTESLYRNISGYFIAGGLIQIDEGFHIRPSLLVKDDFKGPTSLDLNAMLIFNSKFWIGGSYRTRSKIFKRDYYDKSPSKLTSLNAIAVLAQFYATERFRIGYSYDYMINQMSSIQSGTHEITLGFTFGKPRNYQISSPRFF